MTLRIFNAWLLAALLIVCGVLLARELRLRVEFEEGSKRMTTLQSSLLEAEKRELGLREDLSELRTQIGKVRSQRDESIEARLGQAADFRRQTEAWSSAVSRWESAVAERDVRLRQMMEREIVLSSQLEKTAARLREAVARLEKENLDSLGVAK